MYIVNTSFIVHSSVHERWLEFARKYVASLPEKGYGEVTFTKVISNDHPGQATYSMQIPVGDMEQYRILTGEVLGECFEASGKLFGEDVLWFVSLLKRVE